jgi:CBS domain-containing protein
MIARDLMNSDFAYVSIDADLEYVAKLLAEGGCGAIPVVDGRFAPIGIVTRSNLSQNGDAGTSTPGDIPAFLLKKRKRPVIFPQDGRSLREVMTQNPVSVPENAALADILRLMESRHLKRIPVVEGDRLVGLVLRKAVMDAMRRDTDAAARIAPGAAAIVSGEAEAPEGRRYPEAISAEAFRALVAAHEHALEKEAAERRQASAAARDARIRELAARRLEETQWRQLLTNARHAAAAGLREYMLARFPAQLCSDGGRAINAPDPHWPETLRGEPADIFRRWRNELQPRGFRIAAQIVDFPDGMPGDAALFLLWGGAEN